MGFFDKLLKAAKSVSDFVDNNNNTAGSSQPSPTAPAPAPKPAAPKPQPRAAAPAAVKIKKTNPSILQTGSVAAQPLQVVNGSLYDTDENGKDVTVEYSFSVSQDFNVGRSHALEIDSVLYYMNTDSSFDYNSADPYISVANCTDRSISSALEACRNGSSPSNVLMYVENANVSQYVTYKMKLKAYGQVIYLYGAKRGKTYDDSYFGVFYGEDALGTELENKLVSAVDTLASTYTENCKYE